VKGRVKALGRRVLYATARRLPEPRRRAFLDLAQSARVLAAGRGTPPRVLGQREAGRLASGGQQIEFVGPAIRVGPKLPPVARYEPPEADAPADVSMKVVESVYDTGEEPPRFDVELLEQLNREYAERRVVPAGKAPVFTRNAQLDTARRHVTWAHRNVDLREKRVLDVGCGTGWVAWVLGNEYGCEASGVDVQRRGAWDELGGPRVSYHTVDIATDNPFPPDTFDRIVSYTVLEHVVHPHAVLSTIYDILKPGGLAWLRVNLYAGTQASHRYRDIYFPWPHLLFTDEVVREFDQRAGRPPRGNAWVNRLSWKHYEHYFALIGFTLRDVQFDREPLDREFYERFEGILGRYPEWDLTTNYFTAVVEKPAD
jgi:SAM-dependent methyltransferase